MQDAYTNCNTKFPFSHTDNDRFWNTDPLTGTYYQISYHVATSKEELPAAEHRIIKYHRNTWTKVSRRWINKQDSVKRVAKRFLDGLQMFHFFNNIMMNSWYKNGICTARKPAHLP